jgi:RNA polymerase sigma-70 factor (ECF subfamily)
MSSAQRPSATNAPIGEEALRHLDALHHFARYLSGRDQEAEELVQETYARALGASAQFAPGTNLRAWLFRILRNAFLDSRRRAKASPIIDGEPDDRAPDADPLRGDAELELLRSAVADDIEAALLALTPDARAIVLLDHEGLTETELAEVLGCAVGTVKSRLSRARADLRERLRDYAKDAKGAKGAKG